MICGRRPNVKTRGRHNRNTTHTQTNKQNKSSVHFNSHQQDMIENNSFSQKPYMKRKMRTRVGRKGGGKGGKKMREEEEEEKKEAEQEEEEGGRGKEEQKKDED